MRRAGQPIRLHTGIRGNSPCYGCHRPWKEPGCHDSCGDFRDYRAEVDRVNGIRAAYYRQPPIKF